MADANIKLTDKAAARINSLAEQEHVAPLLRISVEGGGCSGFSYKMDFDSAVNDDDIIVEKDGAKLAIDSVSVVYMDGSEVDFVTNLIGQSFEIRNPNASSSCGCGTSFSI
ncbi:MAG: iron-sulfur cluster insertion protein ErpA [Alphaproteobacteria bacterium]